MIQLTEDYLTKDAEEYARKFKKNNINSTQLRKFYDDFKALERRILEEQNPTDDWFKKELLPLIKFVKTKIAYSVGRKSQGAHLVSKEFKEYMDKQIDNIETISCFDVFLKHYQALISYFTYISELEDSQKQNSKNLQSRR
ncbi:MAG: type III-A CRISPR-associated protein Csm2 [Spirochaetota bacterium]